MPFLIVISIFLVFNTSHQLLMMFSLAVCILIYKFFWRLNEPKAIFFGLLLFWLSIIIKLFYADFFHISFEGLSISPKIVQTAYVAMTGLLIFAIGIKILLPKEQTNVNEEVKELPFYYDEKRVLIAYVASFAINIILSSNLFAFFGLSEIFNSLSLLRRSFIFILIYIFYTKRLSLKVPLLLLSVEVVFSFFSFFSSFKDLIFSFAVAFLYFPLKFTLKQTVIGSAGIILTLYLLLTWQAVKGQYRHFLNGGEKSQAVVVDRKQALKEFYRLALKADVSDPELWYESVDRLSYIEFFSEATDNVPRAIPFENGKLWKENLLHVLVPRILDPNKKVIYDSEMVNRYTSRRVAGEEQGASFSLGFLAESYIDYGYVYMFIPVFLVGMLFGAVYRYILTNSENHMWGCAIVSPLWVYFNCNGIAGSKILGWIIMYFIVFLLFRKFLLKPLDIYMRGEKVIS